MRRTSFTLFIVVMVTTMVAFAQNGSPTTSPGFTGTAKEIAVQDENGKGYIVFNTITGDYKVVFCEYDYAFSGTGKVEVLGCNVYFSDIQDGYRLFASVTMCKQQGKVSCEVFDRPDMPKVDPISELWTDRNMKDNTLECWKSPK